MNSQEREERQCFGGMRKRTGAKLEKEGKENKQKKKNSLLPIPPLAWELAR